MNSRDIIRIAAFLPQDNKGSGQNVSVVFRDGSSALMETGLRSFITKLANAFTINVKETRKLFGPIVSQKNLIPLVLAPFLLYVPIKSRIPLISGDPAYGYFRLRSVLEVHDSHQRCTLILEGGHDIPVLQSKRIVTSRLRMARRLEAYLLEQYCQAMDQDATRFTYGGIPWPDVILKRGILAGLQLYNTMEVLVWVQVNKALDCQGQNMCRCNLCRLQIAVAALNQLPAQYVVTRGDPLLQKPDCHDDLSRQVTFAVANALQGHKLHEEKSDKFSNKDDDSV